MEIDKNNHRVFYEMCKTIATDEELSKKMLSLGYSYIKMEMVYENGVCVDSTETVFENIAILLFYSKQKHTQHLYDSTNIVGANIYIVFNH